MAGELGYCGLDRRRGALRGDEIRACWDGRTAVVAEPLAAGVRPGERDMGAAIRGFWADPER